MQVLQEILSWSAGRPLWQRDALRRLLVMGALTEGDCAELVALCKREHGLTGSDMSAEPLSAEHLPSPGSGDTEVKLVSLTHHKGANALAPEQTISFGSNLTVVFGENATGKSGYTRIVKQACRSRAREELLGNVLAGSAPLALEASITFTEGGVETTWMSTDQSSGALSSVSVFDSHSAPVYLRDKTDVAFRPFGLDVFDSLALLCGRVKTALQKEQAGYLTPAAPLPVLLAGTKARAVLDGLSAFTDAAEVKSLAVLSTEESSRLAVLRQLRIDRQSANPGMLAKELELKAARFETSAEHIDRILDVCGVSGVEALQGAATSANAAKAALSTLQQGVFSSDLLPGTGAREWRAMWTAVGEFTKLAYPGAASHEFKEGDRCPFCQQPVGATAEERLRHFAEFIASSAQADLKTAEANLGDLLRVLNGLVVRRPDAVAVFAEIAAEDSELGARLEALLAQAEGICSELGEAAATGHWENCAGLVSEAPVELRALAKKVKGRSALLVGQAPGLDPLVAAELGELESRAQLADSLSSVLAEIDRKKRIKLYDECIAETNTTAITKKSTDLTTALVTDQLRNSFQQQLKRLEFKHLVVDLRPAGGSKGALYHQVVFSNAPGIEVAKVLSEGESRTLSLAAFLTELSTAQTKGAIIFDDPVSSLDHAWRERIARCLVMEAKERQVIAFTHDILFLQNLLFESEVQEVACECRQICRGGQVGIASSELPWIAMPVRDRIAKMRDLVQRATKVFNTEGKAAYEPEAERIYGMLRESWEHAVTEVLLNDVVERYRHSIETKKLRVLSDITDADYDAVEDGMGECSRWMRGHDRPAADCTPYPEPHELSKRIDELDGWAKEIRKRREKKKG